MSASRPSSTHSAAVTLVLLASLLFMESCSMGTRTQVDSTSGEAKGPQLYKIIISDTKFQPPKLSIRIGDTIEWQNDDIIPHTATSTDSSAFDSGKIPVHNSWKFTAGKKGAYPYECSLHPNMHGEILVQ